MAKGAEATVRVGVIGTGWWATQFHLPSLRTYGGAELIAVADPDPQRLKPAAEAFDVGLAFEDYRELLSSGAVEAVVIAVPHAFHYEIARDAVEAGVHVLVEKPMVLRTTEAWDLVARAKENGVHLMVGFTYQFTRHARTAREILGSGRLGDLLFVSGLYASMVESYYRGHPEEYAPVFQFPITGPAASTYADPQLSGGGQGQAQLPHAIAMVLGTTGRRATEVMAFVEQWDVPVDLANAITYRLDNGAIGTMGSTGSLRPSQPQQQELRYYGTDGFLLQEMIRGTLEVHYNDGTSEVFPELTDEELYPAFAPSRALVDLVVGKAENTTPGELGALTVECVEAAYRSASESRLVATAELR